MEENNSQSQIIVLNVGGRKYETFQSTLTAYPDTLLGTMFAERNQHLLKPKNGNEYFFDRNGRAFHYIMEYYRSGKLYFPTQLNDENSKFWVTKEEIESELDYFQIDIKDMKEAHLLLSKYLDEFVTFLVEHILRAMRSMEESVEFHLKSNSCRIKPEGESVCTPCKPNIAYKLAKKFHFNISQYLRMKFEGSEVASLPHICNINYANAPDCIKFRVTLKYDYELILRMSHLLKVRFGSGTVEHRTESEQGFYIFRTRTRTEREHRYGFGSEFMNMFEFEHTQVKN
ncbi:3566_t:CDS:2 [Ambispora gerdemannii]|uniref:3566_t:CDS:1 n=1 Tax=Ambispora gerdemannii TaxID=144530 RepID=A0A9N9E5D1_9GLOM|nr:3566_t:CDS:2 [Ambispora gerdemannii]